MFTSPAPVDARVRGGRPVLSSGRLRYPCTAMTDKIRLTQYATKSG